MASDDIGNAQLREFAHAAAPKLLDAMPSLKVHVSSGMLCSVDASDLVSDSSARAVSTSGDEGGARPSVALIAPKDRSRYLEVPFFDSRLSQLAASDVVVTGAGAVLCGELLAARVPAVLLPAPVQEDGHEYFNAVAMEVTGAAVVGPMACVERQMKDEEAVEEEEEMDDEAAQVQRHLRRVQETETAITELLQSEDRRRAMADKAKAHVALGAATTIAAAVAATAAEPRNLDVAVLRPFAPGAADQKLDGTAEGHRLPPQGPPPAVIP